MKIVLASNTAWYLWNFRRGLIKALKARGAIVYIVVPYDETIPYLERIGCEVVQVLINSKGTNPIEELTLLYKYLGVIKRIKPDKVLAFTVKPVIYVGLVSRWLNVVSVPTITGLGTVFIRDTPITSVVRFLYKLALSSAYRIYFQNKDDLGVFVTQGIARAGVAEIVPGSGIDISRFVCRNSTKKECDNGSTRFIFVGRILKDKGVVEYMEAARQMKKLYPNSKFSLLGPLGTDNVSALLYKDLEPYIRDGVVDYLGESEDVRQFIENSDCVVLPSYREGLPRVLLEASAMCRPIVASNVSGCRDVVVDGVNGLLCKVRSSMDLAEKMTMILNLSFEGRQRMGANGRKIVKEQFDEGMVVNRYLKTIYESPNLCG